MHWLWLACTDAERQHGLCVLAFTCRRSAAAIIVRRSPRSAMMVVGTARCNHVGKKKDVDTSALQYLEVTVPSGTGTVPISSSLSFYFGPFTLSSTCCFSTHSFLTGRSSSLTMASTFKRPKTLAAARGVRGPNTLDRTRSGMIPGGNVAAYCRFSSCQLFAHYS